MFGGHEPPVSFHGPAVNLSLFQTDILVLFGLTVRQAQEFAFGNNTVRPEGSRK